MTAVLMFPLVLLLVLGTADCIQIRDFINGRQVCATVNLKNGQMCASLSSFTTLPKTTPRTNFDAQSSTEAPRSPQNTPTGSGVHHSKWHGTDYLMPLCCVMLILLVLNTVVLVVVLIKIRSPAPKSANIYSTLARSNTVACTCSTYQALTTERPSQDDTSSQSYCYVNTNGDKSVKNYAKDKGQGKVKGQGQDKVKGQGQDKVKGQGQDNSKDMTQQKGKDEPDSPREYSYVDVWQSGQSNKDTKSGASGGPSQKPGKRACYLTPMVSGKLFKDRSAQKK